MPAPGVESRRILDAAAVDRALRRMALEIVERDGGSDRDNDAGGDLAVVGIHTRGVEVARRLGDYLAEHLSARPAGGTLDISLHRDDLRRRRAPESLAAAVRATDLPLDLDDRTVVLADDVFFTGRTIRAALDALLAYGRPRAVRLAVLVEREGHRQLPIRPDYVGKTLGTTAAERVRVRFQRLDAGEPDGVWVIGGEAAPSSAG